MTAAEREELENKDLIINCLLDALKNRDITIKAYQNTIRRLNLVLDEYEKQNNVKRV